MKRILINATQAEELRVAMVNGQLLYDLDIEVPSREQKKSNIYKGVITRIEPSLEAAFVNYGAERHGFLPFKEISRMYFDGSAKDAGGRPNIKDAIKVEQEIIVQVEKEERGNKGAALTSFISLAGRFLVAMPHNPRAGGVSRRIEGEDREQVRKVMAELDMPKNMGVIARTAGVGRSTEEMQWDLDYLVQLWSAIEEAADEKPGPFLIYQESDIVIRALRDHYKSDVGEILIDSPKAFDRAHEFMSMVMPNAASKLKLFQDKLPLFNRFQIENQIESAFTRTVNLPSGGAIVIDHTEALTSIDVNSARATKGGDIEETALSTNLEAADEIARQLRIRDLGGLIVIDFIDMLKNKNQREVESRLRRAVYDDRARVQIGRISRFGLLEMSRQRLRPSLGESSQIVCPRCSGQGTIRDIESLSLAVLRLLEEEALKENTGRILARLPVECATYLLNEKRSKIAGIEQRNEVHCVIIPDPNLETPHFEIERVRDNDTLRHESSFKSSYEMTADAAPAYLPEKRAQAAPPPQAAVSRITPPAAPPRPPQPQGEKPAGLISKVFGAIFGRGEKEEEEKQEPRKPAPRKQAKSRRTADGKSGGRGRKPQNTRQRGQKSGGKESGKNTKAEDGKEKRQDGGEGRKKSQPKRSSRGGRGGQRRNASNRPGQGKSQAETADESAKSAASTGQDSKAKSESNESRDSRDRQRPPRKSPRNRRNDSAGEAPKTEASGDKPAQSAATDRDTSSQGGNATPGQERGRSAGSGPEQQPAKDSPSNQHSDSTNAPSTQEKPASTSTGERSDTNRAPSASAAKVSEPSRSDSGTRQTGEGGSPATAADKPPAAARSSDSVTAAKHAEGDSAPRAAGDKPKSEKVPATASSQDD